MKKPRRGHLARRTVPQKVEDRRHPSPPYPRVAGKLHVGKGDATRSVHPICFGSDAKDGPTRGKATKPA